MLELDGQRVLVLGLGLSGRSAAAFCAERGAIVLAADEGNVDLSQGTPLPTSVSVSLSAPFPDPADFDLVVPSPGVPPVRYRERAHRSFTPCGKCWMQGLFVYGYLPGLNMAEQKSEVHR